MIVFTSRDQGCYADGCFGHQRIRDMLANLLEEIDGPASLISELRGPMSDDASEEDDALDLLNDCCEGCYFILYDGDLMLFSEKDD